MTILKAQRFNIERPVTPRVEVKPPSPRAATEAALKGAARPVEPPLTAKSKAAAAERGKAAEDMLFENSNDGFGDLIFETARSGPAAVSTATLTPEDTAPQDSLPRGTQTVAPKAEDAAGPRPTAGAPAEDAPPAAAVAGGEGQGLDGQGTEPQQSTGRRAKRVATGHEEALEAIRKEGLTGRQLRIARRLATAHQLSFTSDLDAVLKLREAGLNPFEKSSMLDFVTAEGGAGGQPPLQPGRSLTPLPGDDSRLPQTAKPIQPPSTEVRTEINHAADILRMQGDIAKRRRRKLALLFARMFIFVFLPTVIAGWYFMTAATKQYATKSEFSVQMAESPIRAASGMGGLLQGTAMATAQDSIAVQGYLQSRDAMLRLEGDLGFRSHFQGDNIDPLLRLPPDASLEEAYKVYKRHIIISYDTTEGIIRMEVIAPDPDLAKRWAEQLIGYAEEQVDQLTQRLREDTMKGARESFEDAEANMLASQQRVVELQEQFKMISSESEAGLLTTQIGQLETQITQERLSLAQMEANPNPNQARMEPIRRRIGTLEEQVALMRKRLTESENGGISLAGIQGQLLVAQSDVETRQLILSQSIASMEASRIDASRQTRYLSTSVSPIAPDEPAYPRVFENTMVTMLILMGIYLMISMTVAILREQVSS